MAIARKWISGQTQEVFGMDGATVSSAIRTLQQSEEALLEAGYKDIIFSVEQEYEYGEYGSPELRLTYSRLETDKEYNSRVKRINAAKASAPARKAKAAAKVKAKDLKELERLTKKYGAIV